MASPVGWRNGCCCLLLFTTSMDCSCFFCLPAVWLSPKRRHSMYPCLEKVCRVGRVAPDTLPYVSRKRNAGRSLAAQLKPLRGGVFGPIFIVYNATRYHIVFLTEIPRFHLLRIRATVQLMAKQPSQVHVRHPLPARINTWRHHPLLRRSGLSPPDDRNPRYSAATATCCTPLYPPSAALFVVFSSDNHPGTSNEPTAFPSTGTQGAMESEGRDALLRRSAAIPSD